MRVKPNPSYFYINPTTIRFAFDEEISRNNAEIIAQFQQFITQKNFSGFIECVPGYHTLLVYFEKDRAISMQELFIEWQRFNPSEIASVHQIIKIPVCYDEEFAQDMERVMDYTKLSHEEIVQIHSQTLYDVFLIGFLPGFPYLGQLDERLHVPRLKIPRKQITAGTVGIGGAQTGIYPIDSPGGWNIIGKTPVKLFDLNRENPFLLEPHCKVKMIKITKSEFDELLRNEL